MMGAAFAAILLVAIGDILIVDDIRKLRRKVDRLQKRMVEHESESFSSYVRSLVTTDEET